MDFIDFAAILNMEDYV